MASFSSAGSPHHTVPFLSLASLSLKPQALGGQGRGGLWTVQPPHQMFQGERNPCFQSLCPFCLTPTQVAQLLSPLTLLTGGSRWSYLKRNGEYGILTWGWWQSAHIWLDVRWEGWLDILAGGQVGRYAAPGSHGGCGVPWNR